jgi:hypothetical protein
MIATFLHVSSWHQVAKCLKQSTFSQHVRIVSISADCTKHASKNTVRGHYRLKLHAVGTFVPTIFGGMLGDTFGATYRQ